MQKIHDEIQLDENTRKLIFDINKELESKDKELKSKDIEINALKIEIENLKSIILNRNKKIFGKSSEKFSGEQLSLFNEAELYSDLKKEEPEKEEIKYIRNKSSKKNTKKENLSELERVTIHHKLEENERQCDCCSTPMDFIGTTSKEILKYIPAKLYVEEHINYSYACKSCQPEEEKTNIITSKAPNTLLSKSMASNEILSHVISLKYLYALPLYRQENYFKMLGLSLSRQTLSNWIVRAANEFELIYKIMKKELLKRNYIQADETTLKVLEKNGDESRTKHYMWLYKSGTNINPIILYEYQRTRSGTNPKNFLEKFSGYLQTDGYAGYNRVKNVKQLYCLAHIRRKFHDIVITLSKEAREESLAYKGFVYCEKLYKIEKELREKYSKNDDYFDIRYNVRLEKSAPIIDEFIEFINANIYNSLGQSALGRALEYAKNHVPNFKIFLEDGSLEIDNNASERAIKPFIIGRKNWLFCKTEKGAKASSIIYSIMETAKANKLMVEKYLTYLINALSNLKIDDKSKLKDLMPWSKSLPDNLKIPTK